MRREPAVAMPRLCRRMLVAEGSTNHCTWRVHNHTRAFEEPGARRKFLELLGRHKDRHGVRIHSYCLMGTHPHLTCTSRHGQAAFSAFWKVVNHGFARWFNRQQARRGQVVMERLLSPRIQPDGRHHLTVMRYGDLNPVRAGIVRSPKEFPWSSYRHYAFGEPDDLIDDAPDYLALGETAPQRRRAYQLLFASGHSADHGVRRPELVHHPFIGSAAWVAERLASLPPSRAPS